MGDKPYQEILTLVRDLTPDDQVRLLEELSLRVRGRSGLAARRHIQEMRGLGKVLWKGVDPEKYVNRERASWNG